MKKINIEKLKNKTIVNVENTSTYFLYPKKLKDISLKKEIIFHFSKSNHSTRIIFKCVAENNTVLDLKITLMAEESNLKNIEASLETHILNLGEENSITVKPILKIPQDNILFEHKVTIGTPSDKWVKYLNSRGLSYKKALQLIAHGFITGY